MIAVVLSTVIISFARVEPSEIQARQAELVILDARPSMKDYLSGHLPGALYVAPDNWRSTAEGTPGEIHPPEVLRTLFGRLGLREDKDIVVYGTGNDPDAALVASVLRMHGFQAALLNGGIERWTRDGLPISKEIPRPRASRPKATRMKNVLASFPEVLAAVKSPGNSVIVDVRPKDQFEAGRIPGAISFFWKENLWAGDGVPASGLLRNHAELKEAYRSLGVTPDKTVYVYCNSGHMASVGWFVLKVLLGYPDVRLYDGSWIDWSSRPDAPKESGKPGEATARAAADALTRDLQSRLVAEMRAGGPSRAVAVCAEIAPKVAAEHSKDGVVVRRVTLRPRNPGNAADPFEREILERWAEGAKTGTPPSEVVKEMATEQGAVLRYLRPISIGAVCLNCHGSRDGMDAAVRAVLDANYPADQAVGYAAGDLRGAVSVSVPIGR